MNPVIIIEMHRPIRSLIVKILEKLNVFMGADQEYNFINILNSKKTWNSINSSLKIEELLSYLNQIISNLSKFLELENKMIPTKEFINPKRNLAFKNNPELVNFYCKIKDDELVKKLNYGDLIENP